MTAKNSLFITGALVLSLALVSCSIQKRLYARGYHVEWNRSKTVVEPSCVDVVTRPGEPPSSVAIMDKVSASEKEIPVAVPPFNNVLTDQLPVPVKPISINKINTSVTSARQQKAGSGVRKYITPVATGKMKPLSIISFALTIVSLTFLGLYIWGSIGSLALAAFAVTAVAAIITGIITLNTIKEQERGKGLAMIGLTLFAILGLLLMAGI